jgi:hypothetical protein
MTFTEIVTDTMDRLNLSSADATARIGRFVNSRYRRVTSTIGLQTSRRTTVSTAVTLGVQAVVLALEKVLTVYHSGTGVQSVLPEITYDQMRNRGAGAGTIPTCYCIASMDANSVTILLDILPQSALDIYADGMANVSTLSGSTEPPFSASYHDVLVYGAMADELTKMEKPQLAKQAEQRYEEVLSDLRMYIAKSAYLQQRQNGFAEGQGGTSGGASGGGAPSGVASYTQSGLVTFSRVPNAPFAVAAGSPVVPNLVASSANTAVTAALADDSMLLGGEAASDFHDAAQLTGVVPNASFPATLPAASGVNLTALNATNIASGTLAAARLPATAVKTDAAQSFTAGVLNHATQPRCSVRKTSTQTLTSGAFVDLTFDSEVYDVGAMHDGTNPDRITVPVGGGGLYLIAALASFAGSGTGRRFVLVTVNGTAVDGVRMNPATADIMGVPLTTIRNLAAGDIVRLQAFQDSGGDLTVGNLGAEDATTALHVVKIW